MMNRRQYISICVITLYLVTGGAFAADPKSQLVDMAEKIAGTKEFSVSIHMAYDVLQESGQKIEFSEIRHVLLSRPKHMRVDAQQSDGDVSSLLFDGQALTLFNAAENVYSQTDRSGDLDAVIRYAVGTLGIRVPLARMLVTTFPQDIQKLTSNIDYVERSTLGERSLIKLLAEQKMWITRSGLQKTTYPRALY